MRRTVKRVGLTLALLLMSVPAWTQTSTTSRTVKFSVVAVDGNEVVVRTDTGTNSYQVPDDFRFTVNGTPMSVHELKPGMAGTATITTTVTTRPVVVTEVKNGTVMRKIGNSVIVRGPNGMHMYSEGDVAEQHIRIYRDNKPISITDLSEGDSLTALFVTQKPPKVMTQREVDMTLASAGGSGRGAGSGAGAGAGAAAGAGSARGSGSGASTGAAPGLSASASTGGSRQLPKTASPIPLLGLIGGGLVTGGALLTALRRRRSR